MEHIGAGLKGLMGRIDARLRMHGVRYKAGVKYQEYMESEAWRQRRLQLFRSRNQWCCERCGLTAEGSLRLTRHGLEVHHKTYERLRAELDEDLEVLCHHCHEKETFGAWTPEMRTWWQDVGFDKYGSALYIPEPEDED